MATKGAGYSCRQLGGGQLISCCPSQGSWGGSGRGLLSRAFLEATWDRILISAGLAAGRGMLAYVYLCPSSNVTSQCSGHHPPPPPHTHTQSIAILSSSYGFRNASLLISFFSLLFFPLCGFLLTVFLTGR